MKYFRHLLFAAFIFVFSIPALAQSSSNPQFNRDGVSFSYPAGWAFSDSSTASSTEVIFGNANLDANLTVAVSKSLLTSPEKVSAAKKVMVDQYIKSMADSFTDAAGKPVSTASTSQIASVKADGVKLKVMFKGVPGTVEIVWSVIKNRLVVLTLRGPEAAYLSGRPIWDMVRNTLKIGPAPKIKGIK